MRLPVGTDVTSIPGLPGRRKLSFLNVAGGATVYWGYTPDITANLGDAACGVPLAAGSGKDFGDADGDHSKPVYFIAATPTTVYYTGL